MRLYVDPGLRACGVALFDGAQLVDAGFPEVAPAGAGGTGGGGHMRTDRPDERAAAWLAMRSALNRWTLINVHSMITELCIELPQVYDRGNMSKRKSGTDNNDLIHLAAVVAAICSDYPPQRLLVMLPHEWKGTIPKEVMHARATGADLAPPRRIAAFGGAVASYRAEGGPVLTPAELAVIPKLPKSKLHNVLDAVCMGLVMCGRLRTGGLGPRPGA
jgi:hypothetical protein